MTPSCAAATSCYWVEDVAVHWECTRCRMCNVWRTIVSQHFCTGTRTHPRPMRRPAADAAPVSLANRSRLATCQYGGLLQRTQRLQHACKAAWHCTARCLLLRARRRALPAGLAAGPTRGCKRCMARPLMQCWQAITVASVAVVWCGLPIPAPLFGLDACAGCMGVEGFWRRRGSVAKQLLHALGPQLCKNTACSSLAAFAQPRTRGVGHERAGGPPCRLALAHTSLGYQLKVHSTEDLAARRQQGRYTAREGQAPVTPGSHPAPDFFG